MQLAKRIRSLFATGLLISALAGCSSAPDPAFTALKNTPPQAGMARVVIYYPSHFLLSGETINPELNGTGHCQLESGSYMVQEIEPGNAVLRVSFCSLSRSAPFPIAAAPGGKYYIRVAPYDSSITGILSGYPSEDTTYAEKPHGPGFEVVSVKEAEALPEIEKLKRVQDK